MKKSLFATLSVFLFLSTASAFTADEVVAMMTNKTVLAKIGDGEVLSIISAGKLDPVSIQQVTVLHLVQGKYERSVFEVTVGLDSTTLKRTVMKVSESTKVGK